MTQHKGIEDYAERQEAKRDRLEAAADRAAAESRSRLNAAHAEADGIPMGQPILVGHHSEKRHRAALKRIDGNYRKGYEAEQRAGQLRGRAAGLGHGGISSDDPEAVVKLRDKLAGLERDRDRMKRYNVAYRKAKRPGADDLEGWAQMAAILGIEPDRLEQMRRDWGSRYSWEQQPYPAYTLTNLGARIRQAKGRIQQLERQASAPEREPVEVGGFKVYEDREENRVCLEFPTERQRREVCQAVKRQGFRWNRRLGVWTRMLNNSGWNAALYVVEEQIPRALNN